MGASFFTGTSGALVGLATDTRLCANLACLGGKGGTLDVLDDLAVKGMVGGVESVEVLLTLRALEGGTWLKDRGSAVSREVRQGN